MKHPITAYHAARCNLFNNVQIMHIFISALVARDREKWYGRVLTAA